MREGERGARLGRGAWMCTDIARVGFERVGVVRKAGGGWDDELRVVVGGVSRPVLDVGDVASDWVCRWWPRLRGGVDGGEGWWWWWWATTKQPKKRKEKKGKGVSISRSRGTKERGETDLTLYTNVNYNNNSSTLA